jgi:hypothetical protein
LKDAKDDKMMVANLSGLIMFMMTIAKRSQANRLSKVQVLIATSTMNILGCFEDSKGMLWMRESKGHYAVMAHEQLCF